MLSLQIELKVCLCIQARAHVNGQLEKELVTSIESHSQLGAILLNNCVRACLSLRSPYRLSHHLKTVML